jgi:hypothetical protein
MKIERQVRVQRVLDFGYFFSHKSTPFGGPCRVPCNKANTTNSLAKLDGDLAVACFSRASAQVTLCGFGRDTLHHEN